jgi:hypothetical protein
MFETGKGQVSLIVDTSVFYFTDAIQDLIIVTQCFEWIIMINMIKYQDGKTVAEIMFLTSEKKSRDKFRNREGRIMKIYYVFSGFYLVEMVMYILNA